MKYRSNEKDFCELKRLFCLSFGEEAALAEEILGFARDYGEIFYLKQEDKVITMLCLAELEDGLKYLFAAATDPQNRKKGLLARNLTLAAQDCSIVCIPESEGLFALYDRLGFVNHGCVLKAKVLGETNASRESDPDLERLYRIYESSSFYPKKSREMFLSTVRCHLLYGGFLVSGDSYYALCGKAAGENYIYELCLPKGGEDRLPEIAKHCFKGEATVFLPLSYSKILNNHRIIHQKKQLFALKSTDYNANDLYINIMYN